MIMTLFLAQLNCATSVPFVDTGAVLVAARLYLVIAHRSSHNSR